MPNQNLCITDITNVYLSKWADGQWSRKNFCERKNDGIILCINGNIEYKFESLSITAKAGDILAFPGNVPYSGKQIAPGETEFIVIDFCCIDPGEFKSLGIPLVTHLKDVKLFSEKFKKILNIWNEKRINSHILIKSLVYELIYNITEYNSPSSSDATNKIIKYIGENFINPNLSIKSLCKEFFISESQLRRNISKATGLTPNHYILHLRLKKSKNELMCTTKNIKTISSECGFASQYYFSKCFLKEFNMSPTEYRKNNRNLL